MSFETAMVLEKEKAELLQVIAEKDAEIADLKNANPVELVKMLKRERNKVAPVKKK